MSATSREETHLIWAARASLAVAVFLIGLKLYGWLSTDALSLLASLADSAMDLAASAITFIGVHRALEPADETHRFGHGKAEPLAALAQSAFMCGIAVFVLVEAAQRVDGASPVAATGVGLWVMGISLSATLALVLYQRWVVHRTRSIAIDADSLHYVGDVLANVAVILALLLVSYPGLAWVDTLVAALIAGLLLYAAVGIGRRAMDQLMDRALPDADLADISALCAAQPRVRAVGTLRTRLMGRHAFIEVEILLPADMVLGEADDVASQVSTVLSEHFERADIVVIAKPAAQ